jgi:hypothetical protein
MGPDRQPLTFISEREPPHLRERFEGFETDHPRALYSHNGYLVLFDEPRPRFALVASLLVDETY